MNATQQVPKPYINRLSMRNRAMRALWSVVYACAFRPSPTLFHGWRRFLLRSFGASIGKGAHPYPRCRVWAPWNLKMGEHSCLADHVDCYSVAPITLGDHALVSQYSFLCAATHNYEDQEFPLVPMPITIGANAWVAADAFIGPGVSVGDGAVVGARSTVVKDVAPWMVVAGNPAKVIKPRRMRAANG